MIVFIGKNATGKSSLINALECFNYNINSFVQQLPLGIESVNPEILINIELNNKDFKN